MGRTASPPFFAPPTAREIALLLTLLTFLLITTSNLTTSSSQFNDYSFLQSPSTTHRNPANANDTIEPTKFETVLSWEGSKKVPDTVIVAHAPGWTILDRLYALNNTLYIVTDDPASVPEKKFIISTALRIANGPIEAKKRIPTDKELRIISTADAKDLFGSGADVLDGVTVSLVFLALAVVHELTNNGSGMPTIQANCEVPPYPRRRHAADPIDPASPIIITGLLSSFSDSGGRIPRLTPPSRRTETRPYLRHAGCCSHISMPTTGGITLK